MIRQTKKTRREKLNELLLVAALLLSPSLLRFMSPATLHAQSNGTTNTLEFSDPSEISAGAPGLKITIYGDYPKGAPGSFCFYTVGGTSGTPLTPLAGDTGSVELQIPAGSIQEIPASAFSGGVFTALAYVASSASETCNGKPTTSTNTLPIPIQAPTIQNTDLDTLTARNTTLGGNPAPREIYLQGMDFVSKEATVTFSDGSTSFAGAVTVVSSTSARVDVPADLPAGAKSVDLTYCTHTSSADYCATPVTYPVQQLQPNPGTLTATPSPTTPTTATSLQAVFGSTDGYGVPSGLVTFTDGSTPLNTAPLAFTSGQFVATNPPAAAANSFDDSPKSIVADLNQDGLQDVILYASNTLQIFYAADNLGGLAWGGSSVGFKGVEFARDSDFCGSYVAVTTGDFNGDGYPDLAMLCIAPGGGSDNVLVYLNQQDGTFAERSTVFSVPSADLIVAADFNKDGKIDILLAGPDGNTDINGQSLNGFTTYLGDGAGNFGSALTIDAQLADGLQIAAVDFNNDGFPDIALLYHNFGTDSPDSRIVVFQNDGKGTFPANPAYARELGDVGATFQFFTPTPLGSKYPNILALRNGGDPGFTVVLNNQTSTIDFSTTAYVTPLDNLQTATMGDFNGDGYPDVAIYDGTSISVYNSDKNGLYDKPIDSFTESISSINLLVGSSDANGDGYSDPIAFITPSDGPRLVQQYITSGTATATLPNQFFAAGTHSLTATTPGTPLLSPGSATATLMSNGPTQVAVSKAILSTSPASPTTYAPSNPVTLIAEVDSSTSPAPTGSVTFIDTQTSMPLATVPLTPTSGTQSTASFGIGTLTAGTYTYSATYSGDTAYFPTTLSSTTIIVNKATPVVSFVPNPATITYGTALSSAQLDATATLGGSAVAGTFVYTDASGTAVNTTNILPAGGNNITATFTPTDTTDYTTPAVVTRTITVNKATPVVVFVPNPATLAAGAPLTAAQLDATATFGGSTVPGSFVYTNASGTAVTVGTVLPAGANVITASFTPSNTSNFNVPAGVAATITLNAATTTLTFVPNPATITFGTALSSAQLDATATSGGSPVAGTFVYTNASGAVVNTTTVLPTGSNPITVNFTPSDTTSFSTPTPITSTITVSKATPTITWTAPAAIPYGTALSATQLNATASFNGTPVAGMFVYNPVAGTVLTAGTHSLGVTFTPTDTTDFNVATGSTSITVGQDTPIITWTAPAAISYGTALSATQLDATASFNGTPVAGAFVYNPVAGTVLTAGTHPLSVTFTPTDTTDYTGATGSTSITVGQSTPTITWTAPAAIPYGTALSATQLNATASFNGTAVAGAFVYNPVAGTVLTAGTHSLSVTFTPTDTTDFTGATGSTSITVGQDTPVITWTAPAAISYGTALSATQLNATASFNGTAVAGSFVYNPVAGTVLAAGTHSLSVTFTPTDTTDFTGATGSTNITVGQDTPIITWAAPAAIPYGTALSATQLNATASFNGTAVAGTFIYNPASGTVLTAGSHTLAVTFTPTDATDFTGATGSTSITVGQDTPTITWATPAAISYGTALSATQLNATASFNGTAVAGTFVYNPASGTVLAAGTHALAVTFTPTDTTDFTGATGAVNITVGQDTPTITWATPAAISYGTALSGTQLNATASFNGTAVAGTFSYNPASGTVLTAGSHSLSVTFTPTDTTDFTGATGSVSITVGQSTPTITWAAPAAISYGTALSATQLNATASFSGTTVPGTFSYTPASGVVLPAGTHSLSVTFTPTDTSDFAVATGSVSLTVGQSAPTITWATPAAISYGTALSLTQLNATASFNGSTVAGAFSYNPASGTVLTTGTHTLSVTFTPTDATDFTVATGSVNISVGQTAPTITWAAPAQIAYGTALSGTQLNATASFNGNSVEGTFVYNPVAGTVLTAGTHSLGVTFTPMDTTNFAVATGSVSITVGQSTPTVTWATPAAISYGTALSATQLNATAAFNGTAVAGTFSYNPASGTVLTGGTHTLSVTFTPTDATDFAVATGSTTITVGKSAPTITWTAPAAIPYGTALSATQLNATASFNGTAIAGTFVYNPVAGTVLTAGTHSLAVTFTPTDTTDFTGATGSTSITVGQSTPTITWATPASIAYGTALSATQLNATASFNGSSVEGTFVYNPVAGTVLTAGTHTLGVTFTPMDTTNFTTATGSVSISVGQSTPTITWAAPAAIPYGTALSATQLNATANFNGTAVAGTFVYNPVAGTVLTAGTHTLSVTFTPTDVTDFGAATGSTSISVGQSTPTITWLTPAAIPYGTTLSATQLNATVSFNGNAVAGTFVYTPAAGTVLAAGSHTLSVTFTPTDATDFSVATGSTTISVGQSTPTIAWATPAAIPYGTALSATQLNATASFNGTAVAGTFSYNPAAGAVLAAGSHTLSVTFTPTDATDFAVATGSVSITVGQSTPTITWAAPAAIPYGTALSATQLNATASFNGTAVAGTFTYNPPSGTILTAGSHSLSVTFTPIDATDFAVATGSVSITVGQSTPTITWTTPASIAYGTPLAAAQLNATATFNGTAVAGTFSYTPASGTVLTAGSHTLSVTFTPTDATDFAVATGSTTIAVGQSTPVIMWAPPAAISLGTALSAAQLNATATGIGGVALPGTFTYAPAAGAVPPVGANTLGVTFTPTDAADYSTATASVPLTVNPALTTTTVATSASPAQFGQLVTFTVSVTSAYAGAAITGPVSVFDGSTLLGTVQLPNVTVSTSTLSPGTHNITAVYGGNTNFGGSSSAPLAQTISSATTVINWPQPASVPYGTKLSATQLNATVSTAFAQTVPGTFTYTPAAGTLLTAGSQTLSVLFAPTDTNSFKTATAAVTLVVTKVAPTLNWAAPANITAGTPLGATQLNATATDITGNALPGVFTYTPVSGTILAPGATTLSASFAPTDTVDYTTGSISVALNVDPAVATIAVTSTVNPSQFGQPVTLNVNITSAYTASPISGTVTISDGKTVLGTPTLTNGVASLTTSTLTAGVHNITASFAGNATFAAATSPALEQTVNPATTTITWPTPAGISYGTLLSATQLNATVATAYTTTVPGTFVYTPAAGTLLTAGTQTLSVAFTPTDTVNFKAATGTVTIAVGKIAPTITWPTPADVVAGTTLSATQLNATASGISGALPGTFVYTPASGTVLTAGAQTLNVTFTPTDLVNYTTTTASVPLNVIGLALSTLSTTSVKLGDQALTLTLTGTGFLSNSVVYVGATAVTTTFVNPTTLTAVIPASNFLTVQTLQITVNDPTQAQTSNALAIVVGAPPAAITVNGPATVTPGMQPNLTFTVATYAVPITATLTLTFTPAPGLTTDGTILFPNGSTTTTFTIPANTTTIPAVQFQSGSVAGTITVTLHLTAGGVDVTPTPAPTLVITSPPAVPGVNGVTLDRSGDTLTVTIQGNSNTRDIEQIHFHFIAAPGQSLATSDLVIDGTALFNAWYTNAASPTYGSTFHYIQVFNLDQDATVVGQVQVTLVNSQGNSQTVSAQ